MERMRATVSFLFTSAVFSVLSNVSLSVFNTFLTHHSLKIVPTHCVAPDPDALIPLVSRGLAIWKPRSDQGSGGQADSPRP